MPDERPRRLLIVTPTYDERENIEAFLSAVLAAVPEAHVLVVDDASPDGTGALVRARAAADSRIALLERPGKLGLGTAYVAGFGHALAHGYDVVCEMDADLSHDPRHLAALLAALDAGADVAIGSRAVAGGGVVGWGPGRQLLSRGGSLYARAVLGLGARTLGGPRVPVADLTTGFKAYRRRALEAIDVGSLRSNGYAFQIETTYRALCRGLAVVEVPIVFHDRRVGRSKMSRRVFAEAVAMVWRLRAAALRGA
ncbi:MAG: polyprenol monophosphomannose synthase [Myxococcales bacterium]|nr:polyprenol monophosphomannose synthase [Myxococcales bacterium]